MRRTLIFLSMLLPLLFVSCNDDDKQENPDETILRMEGKYALHDYTADRVNRVYDIYNPTMGDKRIEIDHIGSGYLEMECKEYGRYGWEDVGEYKFTYADGQLHTTSRDFNFLITDDGTLQVTHLDNNTLILQSNAGMKTSYRFVRIDN